MEPQRAPTRPAASCRQSPRLIRKRRLARLAIASSILVSLSACEPEAHVEESTSLDEGRAFVSRLDNPDIRFTNIPFKEVPTKSGPKPLVIEVTNDGHRVDRGDFRVETFNGDGPAFPSGVSPFPAVSDEELPARPDAVGIYDSSSISRVELTAQGLRLGYNWMNAGLVQSLPSGAKIRDFPQPRLSLDPQVALVPVQAIVVWHSRDGSGAMENGMAAQGLIPQLALWDRTPFPDTVRITDGSSGGETSSVSHRMRWLRRDAAGQYMVGTQTAPDTIFDKCGVQFRLVNYFEMKVPLRNVVPARGNEASDPNRFWAQGTLDDAPLRENLRLAQADPKFRDGALNVIFMTRVGFHDAPEIGRALIGLSTIGISLLDNRSTSGVIGHEIGHLAGLRHGGQGFDIMLDPGPGTEPTPRECARINEWAQAFRPFWTKPPPERPNP